jgi:hypothetical protein
MKFKPTYGATPAIVGPMPRYNAFHPPSFLYMSTISSNMPGNFWCASLDPNSLKDADCIDNRVRTISRGYVNVTEVMPAAAPQNSRFSALRGFPGVVSKYF